MTDVSNGKGIQAGTVIIVRGHILPTKGVLVLFFFNLILMGEGEGLGTRLAILYLQQLVAELQ